MRILFYRYNSICEPDIMAAFRLLGHKVDEETAEVVNKELPPEECVRLVSKRLMEQEYQFIFSINFFPTLAEICNIFKIPYVCWVVDCPVLELYSFSLAKPWNRVFIFDRKMYEEFVNVNPENIYYYPLATNMEHNKEMVSQIGDEDRKKYSHDVSFIGSLYREKCPYNQVITKLPDYMRGYFAGLIEVQYSVYGYNFIEEVLTDEMVEKFNECVGHYPFPELSYHNDKAVLAHLFLNTKVAEIERYRMLGALSERYDVNVYTGSDTTSLPRIHNRGFAKSFDEMPKIFHLSKINLNITAKPIRSGLSLRIWDVLGCGGFLISNYQEEIPEYFEIGRDLEVYENSNDLFDKVGYYLAHEEERKQIARNGYEKVKAMHSYVHRISKMIDMVFND